MGRVERPDMPSEMASGGEAVPAYILAGGASRRFGSDKARAELDSVPLIVRLARRLEPHVRRVTVVASCADEYADLNLHTVGDLIPGRGPLGGLFTALCDAEDAEWLLLLSCDLTEFNGAWLRALLAERTLDARIVAFQTDPWQPFPALYHRDLVPTVRQAIDQEQLSMQRLLRSARTVSARLPPDWPEVPQANTREELERYRVKA
jgi:molybdopterin-guanine dinucleotide biosynthesis protein A